MFQLENERVYLLLTNLRFWLLRGRINECPRIKKGYLQWWLFSQFNRRMFSFLVKINFPTVIGEINCYPSSLILFILLFQHTYFLNIYFFTFFAFLIYRHLKVRVHTNVNYHFDFMIYPVLNVIPTDIYIYLLYNYLHLRV